MKDKYFEKIVVGGKTYCISGNQFRGSSFVKRIQNINNEKDELIIKINTKKEADERFKNEIAFLKENSSPYFPKLLSSGTISYGKFKNDSENENYLYYVMPCYETSLTDFHVQNLSYINRLLLFLKILKAVSKLHSKGIIHRDLKPDNILIHKGEPILCDFGIAKFPNLEVTVPSDRLANSNYCAPEQRQKPYPPFGKYTDIYPLGLILNELFTGRIINGNNYLKIRDVAPSYARLDDIVALMIESDYKKRIDDISSIIYLVNKYLSERNELEKTYITQMKKSTGIISSNKIIKMLADDCLCIYFLEKNNQDFSTLNVNYHSNIHCRINSQYVASKIVLSKIEAEIDRLFNYENKNIISIYEKGDPIKTCDSNQYEKFCKLLKPHHTKKTEIEIKRIKRKFICLMSYHAEEFIGRAVEIIDKTQSDLNDSPLFYLAYIIQTNCGETISVANVGLFVEPILDLSNSTPIDTEIFYKNKSFDKTLINQLKAIYSNKIIVVSDSGNFSIVFKTKKTFNHFCSMCNSYKRTFDEFDVTIDDIDDMLSDLSIYKGKPELHLSEFAVETLLPKVLEYFVENKDKENLAT